jgi:phage terminase large subunit-like protein
MTATARKMTPSRRSSRKPEPATRRRTRGFHVIKWIEAFCCFTNGEWIGRPFRLLPWQKRLVLELFELRDDGLRRFRWALVLVPKKNGKTELAAALALYFLIGDEEPSPLVVCAAASEDQADLVYGAARRMCELSPALKEITEVYEREILVPSVPGAKLVRVAAAAGSNDGKNIHAVVCDELHEWAPPKGDNVWNVLTNGTGARRQPMVLQISTAGYDEEGTVCGRQYQHGKRVAAGEVEDPTFFFRCWEAPAGADYRNPSVWAAVNPSYGVTVHEEFFRDQLTKKTEGVFRRYFLDQWTRTEEIWLPPGAWDACARPGLELNPRLPLRVGIDVALKHDSCAVVCAQRQEDLTVLRTRTWENPYPEKHELHEDWQLNIFDVQEYLRELYREFPVPACEVDKRIVPGPEFAYDPHFFSESAQILEGDGLALVEFPQNDSRMVPASQHFYQEIVQGRIAHDGDPTLKRHVENVIADQRPRGWRMSKPKGSRKKIDAAIAAAIATDRAQHPAPKRKRSVYEDRGLMTA